MRDPGHPHRSIPGPQAALLQAAFGAQTAQILYVAAKLGIADCLRDAHRTGTELAERLAVDASAVQRVLRGLVSLGVCDETEGSRFGLTPLGEYLRADHPDSVRPRVIFNTEVLHALWAETLETVRTGESASERILRMPFYDHLARNPTAGSLFDQAMASAVRYRLRPTVEAYNFGQFTTIVDVGGGNGALMVEILKAYPQPTGIVFDVPRIAEGARQTLDAAGLTTRCRFLGGDAFEAVPAGGDAYLLSNFLIAWEDNEAVVPLRNCRKAIAPRGKCLLVEWVIPAEDDPKEGFRFWDTVSMDLVMLTVFGSRSGHVRTRSEFQTLLGAAGFELTAVVPTSSSVYVIEALPV